MRTRLALLPFIAILLIGITFAGQQIQSKQPIRIPHVTRAPKIEDFISGKAREAELEITDFRQRKPLDGTPASQPTRAFLSYDDKNLYAAFICTADPHSLRAHMAKREEISGDDSVSLSLDTFHDGQRAYEFFVNPLGVQLDGITAEGMDNDDFSFDTIWHSQGRITETGYVVLIAVPFKSLRFHANPEGRWGVALGRIIPQNSELSTWPHLTEKIEAYVPQFASMESPQHVSSTHNMEFIPYAFGSAERFLDTNAANPSVQTQATFRGGLDAKVVLHDSLTLDATLNPDFSQVESDEPQVTTNQRYEVFFPEKRPFFLENSDFFDTPETLLFTRRIVDPQFGLRLSGKVNNWKLGFLAVDDRAPGKLEAVDSPLRDKRAEIFAGRIQKLFSGSSNLGFMLTRRQFGNSSTTVWGVDSRLKLNQNWVLSSQFIRSNVRDNGVPVDGTAIFTELRHSGRNFNSSTSYRDRSAGFAGNELGFFRRTDIRELDQNVSYLWRPESGNLMSAGPLFSTTATWDHSGTVQDWSVDMPFLLSFKGPSSFTAGRTENYERYQGIGFRKKSSYINFSSDKLRVIGLRAFFSKGTEINFFPASGQLPSLGNQTDASVGLSFRPGSRMSLEQKYVFNRLSALDHSGVLLETQLVRNKINYQFSRALSFRTIVDYNLTGSDPLRVDQEHIKRFNYDLLLTWLLHPGTAFHIGYSDRYENLLSDPTTLPGLRRTDDLSHATARQFFVKLSYAFRY